MSTEDGLHILSTYGEANLLAKIDRHDPGYEFYPHCLVEDQIALDKLLATIRERIS